MRDILNNLRNPRFNHKLLYLAFLPISLLGYKQRSAIQRFATKHWHTAPALAHRLYWAAA
jgi:hypothetical protein